MHIISERIFAGTCLLIGIVFMYMSAEILISRNTLGQGYFSFGVSLILIIASTKILLSSRRMKVKQDFKLNWKENLIIVVSSIVLSLMIRWIGLPLATFIYMGSLTIILGYNWKKAVLIAALFTSFIYCVFVKLLPIYF